MPSAGMIHRAYAELARRAQDDAYECRQKARPDFAHLATRTRARRAMNALEPLVGDEVEAAVAQADRDVATFLRGLDELDELNAA